MNWIHPARRAPALRWLLIALCIAAPVVRYLSRDLPLFSIANADMLAVPALAEQVTRDGLGALTAWYWPPAPYFLYDIVVYGAIWFALPDVWLAPAVFMVVQLLFLYGAIRWLSAALIDGGGDPDDGSTIAAWGAAASFALVLAFASHLADPARFVLVSYYRAGTFIVSLVLLGVVLRWVRAGEVDGRFRPVLITFVVAMAMVVSDPLILPSTLGPLLVVAVLLALVPSESGGWASSRGAVGRHLGALAAAIVVGLAINGWIATNESTYGPAVQGTQIRAQVRLLLDVFGESSWALRIGSFLAVAVAVAAIVIEHRRSGDWRITPRVVAVAFWLVSSASHIVAMVLDTQAPALRYLQVVVLLPLVWAGPILVEAAHRWQADRSAALAIGVRRVREAAVPMLALLPALVVIQPAIGQVGRIDGHYRMPEVECLDVLVPEDSNGVSGYWEARVIMLHSAYDREVAPLNGVGVPMRINASSTWFDRPYDFALVWTQRPAWDPPIAFFEALDPTSTSTDCGTHVILDATGDGFELNAMEEDGAEVEYEGCDFGSFVGQVDEVSCVITVPAGVEGYASFGGYTPLPPGTFVVALTYATDGAAQSVDAEPAGAEPAGAESVGVGSVGVMEVTRLRSPTSEVEIIASEPMRPTGGGGETSLAVTMIVPDDGEAFIAEVRSVTEGAAPFTVLGATIERID